MRSHRSCWLVGLALVTFSGGAAHAVDGVTEINATSSGGGSVGISAPGSYVLTSNLTVPAGDPGIVVRAEDVEIDLNGFVIRGASGGGPAPGIDASGLRGLTVRGGVITEFEGPAIAAALNTKVVETRLDGNGAGIVGGVNCLIVMNVIESGGGPGIDGADGCKIENNIIAGNAGPGIAGKNNVIVHNEVRGNGGGGIVDNGSTIQENVVTSNRLFGISDGLPPTPPGRGPSPPGGPPRSDIIGNVIDNNFSGPGIAFQVPTLITDNTVTNSFSDGIICGASCVIRGNTVDRNNLGTVGGSGGVTVGEGSTVHANSISWNEGFGLTIPPTSGYTNNTITGNGSPLTSGPDVITVSPTVTGGSGNNCSGGPCP